MANKSDGKVPSGGSMLTTSQGTDGGVTNSWQQVLKKNPNSGYFAKDPKSEGRIGSFLGTYTISATNRPTHITRQQKKLQNTLGGHSSLEMRS
jgi:hypothetical protein